jgi:drug/metabolite transporter (DMT)-like permease
MGCRRRNYSVSSKFSFKKGIIYFPYSVCSLFQVFLLTYTVRSAYAVLSLPFLFFLVYRKMTLGFCDKDHEEIPFLRQGAEDVSLKTLLIRKLNWIPTFSTIKYCLILNFIVFFCEVLWYESLKETDVAINTAIYNSLPVFNLIVSVIILKDRINALKVFNSLYN